MDLSAASRDIHELVTSFAELESTSFNQLKELWKSRGFSFIHEACPKDTTQAFFMQSLYSSALGHVKNKEASFSFRLGALFTLYCLYSTQYIEPFYLIYLSLEDLENLYSLVKELRRIEHAEGLKIVRTMLRKEAFLFGCVSVDQKSITDACEKLTNQAAARLKHARFRLLANVPLREHVNGDLQSDLSLESVMDLVRDYAGAKKHVFSGLGVLPSPDDGGLGFADELKDVVDGWEAKKRDLLSINGLKILPLQMQPAPRNKRKRQQEIAMETDQIEDENVEPWMEVLGFVE